MYRDYHPAPIARCVSLTIFIIRGDWPSHHRPCSPCSVPLSADCCSSTSPLPLPTPLPHQTPRPRPPRPFLTMSALDVYRAMRMERSAVILIDYRGNLPYAAAWQHVPHLGDRLRAAATSLLFLRRGTQKAADADAAAAGLFTVAFRGVVLFVGDADGTFIDDLEAERVLPRVNEELDDEAIPARGGGDGAPSPVDGGGGLSDRLPLSASVPAVAQQAGGAPRRGGTWARLRHPRTTAAEAAAAAAAADGAPIQRPPLRRALTAAARPFRAVLPRRGWTPTSAGTWLPWSPSMEPSACSDAEDDEGGGSGGDSVDGSGGGGWSGCRLVTEATTPPSAMSPFHPASPFPSTATLSPRLPPCLLPSSGAAPRVGAVSKIGEVMGVWAGVADADPAAVWGWVEAEVLPQLQRGRASVAAAAAAAAAEVAAAVADTSAITVADGADEVATVTATTVDPTAGAVRVTVRRPLGGTPPVVPPTAVFPPLAHQTGAAGAADAVHLLPSSGGREWGVGAPGDTLRTLQVLLNNEYLHTGTPVRRLPPRRPSRPPTPLISGDDGGGSSGGGGGCGERGMRGGGVTTAAPPRRSPIVGVSPPRQRRRRRRRRGRGGGGGGGEGGGLVAADSKGGVGGGGAAERKEGGGGEGGGSRRRRVTPFLVRTFVGPGSSCGGGAGRGRGGADSDGVGGSSGVLLGSCRSGGGVSGGVGGRIDGRCGGGGRSTYGIRVGGDNGRGGRSKDGCMGGHRLPNDGRSACPAAPAAVVVGGSTSSATAHPRRVLSDVTDTYRQGRG